ncbi:MAG: cysteine dioxygenase family protein [Bacteroidota bacterium]
MEITTIPQLITFLSEKGDHDMKVLEIMKSVTIPQEEFEKYYSWNQKRYTRNVLFRDDKLELILVCMEKGQASPIHDFNSQEAWIHPVVGRLREERYKINPGDDIKLEQISSVLLGPDEYSYMNQVGIHRFTNDYESRSVSLNVYAKPVREWRVYEENTSNAVVQKTWTDKYYDLTPSLGIASNPL